MSIDAFHKREWQLESNEIPLPGTHLVAPRRGYTHHGIYVGDGRVVHYAGFSRGWSRGPVEEVSLADFRRAQSISARFYANPRYDAGEIIERARSRLHEDTYHLLTNNCEHFCEWCVLGTSRSRQVEQLRNGPRQVCSRILSALKRRLGELLGAGSTPSGWAT
jgi:hypothetical protein